MYKFIRPLIFTQDSERVHNLMLWLGENIMSRPPFFNIVKSLYEFEDSSLQTNFLGVNFKNSVGVPAGFDKNARMLDFWPALGLGFAEIGSVTAKAGLGNPRPRMFRLPEDLALINRMGLNNIGADAMAEKLFKRERQKKICDIPMFVNIAKTHDPKILGQDGVEDFCYSFKKLHRFGDFTVLNVSCPNTAEGKTFEEPPALAELLGEIGKIRQAENAGKPVLVKISPDVTLRQLDEILEICESRLIDGYVLCNITSDRSNLKTEPKMLAKIGSHGGVSGEPIRQKTTELIRFAYRKLKRPCVIGLGGVDSAGDAYEKIKVGASLVQVFSGLIFEGPGLVKKINQGLVKLLKKDGFKNISEAVGVEAK